MERISNKLIGDIMKEKLFKKGEVYICSSTFPSFAICIISEKWDEVKQQYIVRYVRGYNLNRESGKFFSYSEKSSEHLNDTIKESYFKIVEDTGLPQLIKVLDKLTSKTLKNINPASYIPISDVTKYYLNSHILFMESKGNEAKLLLINPYEEDKDKFYPSNMKMNLIEINVSISDDETYSINHVLDKPFTLWGFMREYPNVARVNENDTLILKVANLWNTTILKPTKD